MKQLRIALVLALLLAVAAFGIAGAQAYSTTFTTSITYQNVGTQDATVQFQFYNENSANPVVVTRNLPAGAGASLFVGSLTGLEALPPGFLGAAVAGSNQPIVATMVQVPNSSAISVRPLSNGFSSATAQVLLATVLKNTFGYTSKFSIQNADTSAADVSVNLVPTSGSPVQVTAGNIPAGSAKYFDMGKLAELAGASSFNGSATVTAVKTGTQNPANIVGSVMELSIAGLQAVAFEGVSQGATKVFVATALCQLSGSNATTSYAVQNVGNAAADVTVTYQPGGKTATQNVPAGGKKSFNACKAPDNSEVNPVGFSGAATVESAQPLVVIAKAFVDQSPFATAFVGQAAGATKLALPYVRYTSQANYAEVALKDRRQRAFIAIQNVGTTVVSNVTVEYRDKNGNLLGTHILDPIDPGAKKGTNATLATPSGIGTAAKLLEFGNPESQPDGKGFGGGAIVIGPAGSSLASIVRVQSVNANGAVVAEDYNGIGIQ